MKVAADEILIPLLLKNGAAVLNWLFKKKKDDPKSFILNSAVSLIQTSLAFVNDSKFDKTEEHIIYFYGNGVVDFLCQKMKISMEEYQGAYLLLLGVTLNKSVGLSISIESIKEFSAKVKVDKVMTIAALDAKEILSGNENHVPRLFKLIQAYRKKNENIGGQ